jgi:hypothetical protein
MHTTQIREKIKKEKNLAILFSPGYFNRD